jgi:Predicted permeases
MEPFLYALNAVAPLCLLMALGYLLKRGGIVDAPFLKKGNELVFKVLLPVLLFDNVRKFDIVEHFAGRAVVFILTATLALYAVYWIAVARLKTDARDKGVLVQGLTRGNFVIYGLPLCSNLFSDKCLLLVGIVSATLVPVYNLISVIVLEYYGSTAAGASRIKETLRKIAGNPLIIGALAGIFWSLLQSKTGFQTPLFFDRAVDNIARTATPMALLFLGGEFKFNFLSLYRKQAIAVNLIREVLAATLITALAAHLGFRGYELGIIMCVFSSPIAVSSFPMARMSGGNADLAAALVVTTTLFSCVSVFLLIAALRALALI